MKTTLTPAQRRRLEQAIDAHIYRYAQCRRRLGDIDAATYAMGLACFGCEAGLVLWLCAPARDLNWKMPLQHLGTAKGRGKVTNLLMAIQHTVFL